MRSLIPPKKEKSNKEKFINIGSLDYKYYPDQKKLRRNVTHENFNDFLKRMRGGKL